jgi:hypothetical protein
MSDGTGAAGEGTPAADPAAASVSANDPAAAAPAGGKWYDGFKDQGVKEWLGAYGDAYPDAEAVANKALNLEKFVGADKAGRGVIVPKPDATPEEWQSFYKKVGGVPETADGYTLPDEVKNDPMMVKFRDAAHKMGMPPQFFSEIQKWYGSEMKEARDAQYAQWEQQADREMGQLKDEWGQDYDKNVEFSRRAAASFIPHKNPEQLKETLTKIEGAIGSRATMKIFSNIGQSTGEHGFIGGEGNGINGGMTPEGARVRISELKADPAWAKSFASGDADKKAEWDRLHKVAYPNKPS